MTQKDKLLLLQDLCARLPYNLYIRVEEFNVPKNEAITEGFVGNDLKDNRCNDYDADGILNELADDCINVKPYLRPISSMTEEEKEEFEQIRYNAEAKLFNAFSKGGFTLAFHEIDDWLNAHHFDYRGLIGKGLALEAKEGMYNIKEQ